MKNLKMSLALLAVALGFTAAVSTSHAAAHRFSSTYGFNQSTQHWELVKTGYTCDDSENNCTAQFSTPPTGPNSTPIPGTLVQGDFTNGN